MARIAGVDLPARKRAAIGLTYIYGIGRTRALSLLHRAQVDPEKKVGDLSEEEVNHLRNLIEGEGAIEGDLRKEVSMNIKRLMEMGSYRGLRHRRGLPARGQRTHTNARTRKGPRRGTVAGKKKATQDLAGATYGEGTCKIKFARRSPSRRRKRRTFPTGRCTSRHRSTTRLSRSPIRSETCLAWSSSGSLGFRGSRKGTPVCSAAGVADGCEQSQGFGCAYGGSPCGRPGFRP